MTRSVKLRRGNTSQNDNFTGQEAEVSVDLTKKVLRVHDGTTQGGFELVGAAATQALTNKTSIAATTVSTTNAIVSGVATFTNGPVLIGTATSTGTSNQDLQVLGNGYLSGSLGLGYTNPTYKMDVDGDIRSNGSRILHTQTGINTVEFGYSAGSGNTSIYGLYIPLGKSLSVYSGGSFGFNVNTSGNLLVNTTNSTGTPLQPFQVSGGAYFNGRVGIASTNPSSDLYVFGTAVITGVTTFSSAVSSGSSISDSIGNLRAIPQNSQGGAYILAASDAGKHISITTGGVTVNASVFSVGDTITIFNNSGSSQSITQGASVTLRLAATATTGTRTLSQYGICTLLCVVGGATPTFVVSGAGLT